MVATDGHRLAMAEKVLDETFALSGGVIVPKKGFQELKRVLGDSKDVDKVSLGFSSTNALLQAGSVTVCTRLVEGQFPEYDLVIPSTNSKTAKISRSSFSEALRRVSLLSQGGAHGVRLHFSENTLGLVAEDPERGRAEEEIDINYEGEELTVGFNARYMLDVLNHIQDEGVIFALTNDLSPGVLTPLEQQGFLAVVMPMRI